MCGLGPFDTVRVATAEEAISMNLIIKAEYFQQNEHENADWAGAKVQYRDGGKKPMDARGDLNLGESIGLGCVLMRMNCPERHLNSS